MFDDDKDFQKDLIKHHVYTAWQFIRFTRENINMVQYCADVLKNVIEKMENKTVRWEQDLFSDFVDDVDESGRQVKRVSVTTENMPQYELRVAGLKVNPWFLFDKMIRDFYQYSMNCFDSMSQVVNAGLLANDGKKVDAVDFQRMQGWLDRTYKVAFPKTAACFEKIYNSAEFKYMEAVNNRTKHTFEIGNKLSMGILGSSGASEIGPFFRKEVQHDKKELMDQLVATSDFLEQSWDEFLTAFCDEYVLDTFVENRRHEIGGVYQQRIKADPSQDLSYAYVNVETDFSSMPDEIYVLFISDKEEIKAHECPFDTILIREVANQNNPPKILGRYKAEDVVGDDCLLTYRKYKKDMEGGACLFYETQKTQTFYHWNPFFNTTTISDDDDFIKRASLPF